MLFRVRKLLTFFLLVLRPPGSALFPYTTLFRSCPTSALRPRSPAARPRTSTSRSRPTRPVITRRRSGSCSAASAARSEEHTSELQSHSELVCRLLLAKKKLVRSLVVVHKRAAAR